MRTSAHTGVAIRIYTAFLGEENVTFAIFNIMYWYMSCAVILMLRQETLMGTMYTNTCDSYDDTGLFHNDSIPNGGIFGGGRPIGGNYCYVHWLWRICFGYPCVACLGDCETRTKIKKIICNVKKKYLTSDGGCAILSKVKEKDLTRGGFHGRIRNGTAV